MAEAYFNMMAKKHGCRWHAVSGGTCALNGNPASSSAVSLMAEYSASLENFRSSSISVGTLMDSELVICMETAHCKALSEFYPPAAGKIHLLSHWLAGSGCDTDINWLSDSYDFHRSCFEIMKPALDNLFEYVNQIK